MAEDLKYRGMIFDLDGVIVSTDKMHYAAWKMLADEENIYFDRNINDRLRGVSRMDSLEILLEKSKREYTPEGKIQLAERKNEYYKKLIYFLTSDDILPGVFPLLKEMRDHGLLLAIGSSSKNCLTILKCIGLGNFFNAVVDGNMIRNSKPDPEVFINAAKQLNCIRSECLVFEDSYAGVEAGLRAGMDVFSLGAARDHSGAKYSKESLKDTSIYDFMGA